jgi:hypothetical protein
MNNLAPCFFFKYPCPTRTAAPLGVTSNLGWLLKLCIDQYLQTVPERCDNQVTLT